MYEQIGSSGRVKPWLKPMAWLARAMAALWPASLQKPRHWRVPSHAYVSTPQVAASGQFVEQLPTSQEFRLIEELLNALSLPASHNAFYRRLLVEVEAITGARDSVLCCMCPKGRLKKVLAANLEQTAHSMGDLLKMARPLEELVTSLGRHQQPLWISIGEHTDTSSTHDDNEHCRLLLRLPSNRSIGFQECEMLRSISTSLSGIMRNLRRANLDQQFIHSHERALIARELHDSLAQSLSFLKIQQTRLEAALREEAPQLTAGALPRLHGPLADLRKGVELSYRQLRELISTFRLTMNGKGLAQALEDSLEEFENLCDMVFSLDNRLVGVNLSVEEETHMLLVAREALSNATRHSQGTRAEASLWIADDGAVCLNVDDDGIGLKDTIPDSSHGLQIMKQRMQDLDGTLSTVESPLGGVRVQAKFHPHSNKHGKTRRESPHEYA